MMQKCTMPGCKCGNTKHIFGAVYTSWTKMVDGTGKYEELSELRIKYPKTRRKLQLCRITFDANFNKYPELKENTFGKKNLFKICNHSHIMPHVLTAPHNDHSSDAMRKEARRLLEAEFSEEYSSGKRTKN